MSLYAIEYDRNKSKKCESHLANLLISAASSSLCVDFYATTGEAKLLLPNCHIDHLPSAQSHSKLSKLLSIEPISTYVCTQVTTADELKTIWGRYSYSSPKMYRVSESAQTVEEAALRGELVDSFQWIPLDKLFGMLDSHICILRDLHDDIGLEVLCRDNFKARLNYLVGIYLDNHALHSL